MVNPDIVCVMYKMLMCYFVHAASCSNNQHQKGHYRVQNGTVLQECVDQQWTTVDNTSQLLVDIVCLQQNDMINNFLTIKCPNSLSNIKTTIPSTCSGISQDKIGRLITEALATQCSVSPSNNEITTSNKTTEQQQIFDTKSIAIIAVLAVALLATAVGWMITCAVARKKSLNNKLT